MGARFGSGRQQVAPDEKFSAEKDSGDEEEEEEEAERKVGAQRAGEATIVTNGENRVPPWDGEMEARAETGRQSWDSGPERSRGPGRGPKPPPLPPGPLHREGRHESFMREALDWSHTHTLLLLSAPGGLQSEKQENGKLDASALGCGV